MAQSRRKLRYTLQVRAPDPSAPPSSYLFALVAHRREGELAAGIVVEVRERPESEALLVLEDGAGDRRKVRMGDVVAVADPVEATKR